MSVSFHKETASRLLLFRENIIVTPHQTTFLKILDSYLLQLSKSTNSSGPITTGGEELDAFCSLFISKFFELSSYARSSIRHSIGPVGKATGSEVAHTVDATPSQVTQVPLQDLDMLLPKVCEALVLITQCLCTMVLAQDETSIIFVQSKRTKAALSKSTSDQGTGFIEDIIGNSDILFHCLIAYPFPSPLSCAMLLRMRTDDRHLSSCRSAPTFGHFLTSHSPREGNLEYSSARCPTVSTARRTSERQGLQLS